MPVFKKPRSILARSKAVTKLSKLSQFWGGVSTLVVLYSSVVLNAVSTHTDTGISAMIEKRMSRKYFRKVKSLSPMRRSRFA